jgi:hypothetical protein
VNIRFLWEFEEEIGSPNFEKIITKAAPNLRPIRSLFPTRFGFREIVRLAQPDCVDCSVLF